MKRKPTIIGYATIQKVAERLIYRGDPDADDFGLRAIGVSLDHASQAEIDNIIRTAFDILANQQFRFPKQDRLLEALGNSLAKNESQLN